MQNGLTCGLTKNEIFRLTVDELRLTLSNKPKSDKSPFVWSVISLAIFIFPFSVGLGGLMILIKLF